MNKIPSLQLTRGANTVTRVVTGVAIFAAVLIAVAPPVAYFLIHYQNLRVQADTHARFGADLVSRHAYGNPELWRYEEPRLREILLRSQPFGPMLFQRLLDADGTVLIETGAQAEPPTVEGRADVLDSLRPIGTLVVQLTLRPTLVDTALLAVVCLVLAAVIVAVVPLLPLRVLRDAFHRVEAAERELQLARDALEQSTDLVFITDGSGAILYGNARYRAVGPRTPDGKVPACLADFTACLEGLTPGAVQETLDRGAIWQDRYEFCDSDGEWRQADASCWPIRDAEGTATHFIYMEHDITEQARMEAQLRDARRMEALGNLAGGVAHEINNYMTPIAGYAELLLAQSRIGEKERTQLGVIAKAARQAGELVSRILLFSRRAESRRIPWRLTDSLNEVLPLLRISLPPSVTICSQPAKDLAPVDADPTQMNQILMNLCANAAKAMPAGGTISVAMDNVTLDGLKCIHGKMLTGRYVRVAVEDTGVGMDTHTLERAFDPFFTTRSPGEGTGLGLSTLYGAVQQHEGGIVATSRPGAGTRFEVYLPALDEASPLPREEPVGAPQGSASILIVDDDPASLDTFAAILKSLGYRVETTGDPAAALQRFRAGPTRFDLVITDRKMPELSGEELIDEIQRIRGDVPIILCTGYSDSLGPEEAQTLGISRVAMKPLGAGQLGRLVAEVLSGSGERA